MSNFLKIIEFGFMFLTMYYLIGCSNKTDVETERGESSNRGTLVEIIDRDLEDTVSETNEVDGRSTLNRLRGILSKDEENAADRRVSELEYENIEDVSMTLDERVAKEFREELAKIRRSTIYVRERNAVTRSKKEYDQSEINEMILTIINPVAKVQDMFYGNLKIKQATEITALTLDRNGLLRARNIMDGELRNLEVFIAEIKVTEVEINDISELNKRRGVRMPASQLRNYFTYLKRFNDELEKYYKMVIEFNMWIDTNWESFEDEFGTRVIRDVNIGIVYEDRSKDIVNLRTRIERSNRLVNEAFRNLRSLL